MEEGQGKGIKRIERQEGVGKMGEKDIPRILSFTPT